MTHSGVFTKTFRLSMKVDTFQVIKIYKRKIVEQENKRKNSPWDANARSREIKRFCKLLLVSHEDDLTIIQFNYYGINNDSNRSWNRGWFMLR